MICVHHILLERFADICETCWLRLWSFFFLFECFGVDDLFGVECFGIEVSLKDSCLILAGIDCLTCCMSDEDTYRDDENYGGSHSDV